MMLPSCEDVRAERKSEGKKYSQFCDRIRKFSSNFSHKIVAEYRVVSGLTKQNMSPQYFCVKKPLKMANSRQEKSSFVIFYIF